MKYLLKYAVISVILLSSIVLFILGGTTQGLNLELRYMSQQLPGKMTFSNVTGSLFSAFSIENIHYEYQNQHISIQSLQIKWFPEKLLLGQLAFDTLTLKNADVQLNDDISNKTSSSNSFNVSSLTRLLKFVSFNTLNIDHFSLKKDTQLITLNGTLDQNWNIAWTAHLPKLNALISDTNGSLFSDGLIQGSRFKPHVSARIHGNQLAYQENIIDRLDIQANLSTEANSQSSLQLKANGITAFDYHFKQLMVSMTSQVNYLKHDLIATLQLRIPDHTTVEGHIKISDFSLMTAYKKPLASQFSFSTTDLDILTELIPDIAKPQGHLYGNIILQGTLANPILTNQLTLANGQFNLPITGITVHHINLTGKIDNQWLLTFSGHAQSGSGGAQLEGNVNMNDPDYPLRLTLKGNNLDVIKLPGYSAVASPDISLLFAYPKVNLQGHIFIPQATINPKKITSTVSLPDEVVFVGQTEANTESSPIIFTTQLTVKLGEKINIDYDNINARLLGEITITKAADSPAQATGELYTTQGKYTAYGQKLTIDTGRLIYTGNALTNPGLNIRATKQVRRVVTQNISSFNTTTQSQNIPVNTEMVSVGVQVSGVADNPNISLFSSPSGLSQGDILSYLLIGLPQSQASSAQGSILFTALSAYNPDATQAFNFTDKLQKSLGLTELNMESVETYNPVTGATEPTTSVVIGKQITQKLSVHYSIGLFNPVSTVNLRYQLNPHWAVQSETSTIDSGADILYGFEQD